MRTFASHRVNQIQSLLSGPMDFYGVGTVHPVSISKERFETQTQVSTAAIAFRVHGMNEDSQFLFLLIYNPIWDTAPLVELGNILASRMAMRLSIPGEGFLVSPPMMFESQTLKRIERQELFTRLSGYVLVLENESLNLATAVVPIPGLSQEFENV